MATKLKKSPGRPRKDGSPARPRYRDPKTNRFVKSPGSAPGGKTVTASKPIPPAKTGGSGFSLDDLEPGAPVTQAAGGSAIGSDAAAEAVKAAFVGGGTDSPGSKDAGQSAPAVAGAEAFECDWKIVIQTVNTILKLVKEDFAMLPQEEESIGKALDAVIAKYWPDAKNIGPEVALGLALAGYIGRIILQGKFLNFNPASVSAPTEIITPLE